MNHQENEASKNANPQNKDQKLGVGKDIDAQRHPEEQIVDPKKNFGKSPDDKSADDHSKNQNRQRN